MNNLKSLIVITWDGKAKPLDHVLIDTTRVFDLLIFDHSAKANISNIEQLNPEHFLSISTENKGQVLYEIYKYLYQNDNTEKYEYIIDLGKSLPVINDAFKTSDNTIKGCQSKVWLHADLESDKLIFTADSDAINDFFIYSPSIILLTNIKVLDNLM